jgi:DNA-binding CsgD family transcriptional regulator
MRASERARTRCRAQLERLADSGAGGEELRREAIRVLGTAIRFERWCSLLLDPDTLVIGHGIGHNDWAAELPRLNLGSAGLGEINNHTILARSRDHVGVLSSATGNDLARARHWREILAPYGVGDELCCVAVDERGPWGEFILFRDSDEPSFDADDAQLMRELSAVLARGLRRQAVAPAEDGETTPAETGVLLLDAGLEPRGAPAAALKAAGSPFPDGIPGVVWNVVGRLLAVEQGELVGQPPRVRLRAADGRWAVIEAARLDGAAGGITVTVRAAGIDDVLDLVCRAHGLSRRERELVALVIEGLDTRELAERLFISPHTVQDHLKSVFDKVGVRSRRELVSGVFARAA